VGGGVMGRLWFGSLALSLGLVLFGGAVPAGATAPDSSGSPTVTATPSTGLSDGQQIEVTGSGLAPSTEYGIIECQTGATDISGCDISNPPFLTTDDTGAFSTSYEAVRVITVQSPIDCAQADACILAVAPLSGTIAASTPISFADVTIVPPTMMATPSTGLTDEESITVSGSGYTPDAQLLLAECQAPATGTAIDESTCDITTFFPLQADATGSFSASYEVTRVIEPDTTPIDCAVSACVLMAANDDNANQLASVPISFVDSTIPTPVLSATPSTNLKDGQKITVTGQDFRPNDSVTLVECPAGSTVGFECDGFGSVGNSIGVTVDPSGNISATFSVARLVTPGLGSVDCAQAPGCFIGAVDDNSFEATIEASTPIAFNPKAPTLPPLNLALVMNRTGSVFTAGHKAGDAIVSGTITCHRSAPLPVSYQLVLTQQFGQSQPVGLVQGTARCDEGGAKFTTLVPPLSVPGETPAPFAPGVAGVQAQLTASSGSSAELIQANASIELKAQKRS
jgi:hypothetical protein